MSTSAAIFVQQKDDSFEGSYCHFDGMPDSLGEILFNNYSTFKDINQLVEFGNASSIGETVEDSVFYCRDKEEDFDMYECEDEEELNALINDIDVSYIYLFKENEWYYAELDPSGEIEWNLLEELF